jgi:3-oxoacyl-(acyl-carrier-protein) synthase/acyl carrier protein/NADP-dependent 3-hydroxy acid dehydrogenase YdfG
MIPSFDINRYVLEQLKGGNISKDAAFTILKNTKKDKVVTNGDIAVIGMACRLPGAQDVDEYWNNIIGGANCIGDFPVSRQKDIEPIVGTKAGKKSKNYYFSAGYLEDIDKFDAAFFRIPPKEVRLMDPYQRLLLETTWDSIEDSGYGGDSLSGSNTGVYIGADHSFRVLLPSYSQLNNESSEMLSMIGSWTSILASRVSYSFNLKGPGVVVDTACSSGFVAMHMACRALKAGECNMAIAGGINLLMLPLKNSIFKTVESYEGIVRTFDKHAEGTTWAEGVGTLVLKPLNKAIQDRDNIYAVIKGSAINNDGSSNGITAPDAQAQTEVITKAWRDAQINPETISYVESHGTGTVLGDPIEISGLTAAFRRFTNKKQFCAIGTVKTNIGHTVSVSGIAAAIKIIKAFKHNKLPATLNFIEPNSYINFIESPLYVGSRHMNWPKTDTPRRVGISAFGFSGTNCHMVFEEPPESSTEPEDVQGQYLFLLSAKSEASLKGIIEKYHSLFQSGKQLALRDICYTLATGRGHYSYRLAISCSNVEELAERIKLLSETFPENADMSGIYFGYHRLVPQNKAKKQENEITEGERVRLSNDAACILKQYLNPEETEAQMIDELARYYVKGADVQWADLYEGTSALRLSLPTYSYEYRRYWSDKPKKMGSRTTTTKPSIPCHEIFWKPEELKDVTVQPISCVLVINNEDSRANEIIERLAREGISVIQASIGDGFSKVCGEKFVIDGSEDSYIKLFSQLESVGLECIIHMATLNHGEEIQTSEELDRALGYGVYSLLHMAKALKHSKYNRNIDIVLVSEYTNEIIGTEPCVIPENAAFFGLAKGVFIENSDLRCRCIDMDYDTSWEILFKEIQAGHTDFSVAFRNDSRYVETIREKDVSSLKNDALDIAEGSVCVVTGGMGGLGLELAKFISRYQKMKFAMINRSVMPERNLWNEILNSGMDKGLCKKILAVREVEANGSAVHLYTADISSAEQMEALTKRIRNELGRIAGIFHCAGVIRPNLLINKTDSEFAGVLASKVQGTCILDKATRADKPDYMILFSSVSSLFGFPGHSDYATANSYLDAYSTYRNRKGLQTVCINWPVWREAGMALDSTASMDGAFRSISSEEALGMLINIMSKSVNRIAVGEINYKNAFILSNFLKTIRLSSEIRLKINKEINKAESKEIEVKPTIEKPKVKIGGREKKGNSEIEEKLMIIWESVLGMDTIDVYDNFHDMGVESIMAANLLKALEDEYPGIISVTDLFSYPTIAQMAEYIAGKVSLESSCQESKAVSDRGKLSEDKLSVLIKELKNNQSDMEAVLDMIDEVRFLQDE